MTTESQNGPSSALSVASGSPLEVWSFGCIGEPGHYLRRPDGRHEWNEKAQPWGWKLDGGLCEGNQCGLIDGKTWEHHKDGWTAVAMWDRSGDSRGASCTVFLCHADTTTEQIIAAARIQWPQIFSRQGFPLANVRDEPRAKRVGSGPLLGASGASTTQGAEPTQQANDHP